MGESINCKGGKATRTETKIQTVDKSMTQEAQALEQGAVASSSDQSDRKLAQLVYILQAIGIFIGLTFIAGVIINYIKRGEMTTELGKSHTRWQIRTFWFSLLWMVIGSVLAVVVVGYFIVLANLVWVIYRICRGWLRLNDGKSMYATS